MSECFRIARPLLISQILTYYEPENANKSKDKVYTYASAIIILTIGTALCNHHYLLRSISMGMQIRIAMCSLIYRKALKLSKSALAETTIGQMVNLLSNDVSRFDNTAQRLHNLWFAPIEILTIMYLVYAYVGPTGLAGAVFLLLFIPFQGK